MAQPETGAIIKQHLDSCTSPISKDKAVATEWIKIKLTTTNSSIPINAFPEIESLACYINLMGIGNGNHFEPL